MPLLPRPSRRCTVAHVQVCPHPSPPSPFGTAPPLSKSAQTNESSLAGCYTCRLRRKKCDEGSPCCTACRNLGLQCDYKRPMWWSNNDQRRLQKDDIKMIIKRKKLTEKSSSAQVMTPGSDSPPGLSHSLPTSATFTDSIDRTRSASIDSQLSFEFDFNANPGIVDYTAYNAQMHSSHPHYAPFYTEYSPYDVDVKTERQMFVNDSLTRRESTISTISTYHAPLPDMSLPAFTPEGEWVEDAYGSRRESMAAEEPFDMSIFDLPHGLPSAATNVAMGLDETDQRLLDHFIEFVLPTIFPVLETRQQGSAKTDLILPALQSNKCYLHCCLSISAQHYKATMNIQGEQIDNDILRHRYKTISELCDALGRDEEHQQILEATLGMIFFQCSVGRLDDALPDISWHQHFQAAISLVQKLDLARIVTETSENQPTPFNMTLTAWIDILGATMQGRAPTFANTYREKHLAATNSSLGLRELMGCEDRVMYLISEIACLEELKGNGMADIELCQHVHSLGYQIGLMEIGESGPKIPFNANGVLSAKQLTKNITAAFRLAARIYLCSLVPGFSPSQASCVGLVTKLASALEFIPSGPGGFDRSLVWVYLIGGSVSTPSSPFRTLFQDRITGLGELSDVGSFGQVVCLLREVWSHVDGQAALGGSEAQHVSWRDVMQMKDWDFLLI